MRTRHQLTRLLYLLVATAVLAGCNDNDDPVVVEPIATGLQTLMSGDAEREYFLQLPDDYAANPNAVQASAVGDRPLVFAFHGYTGSYENWIGPDRFYDFYDVIAEDAIFVVPNGQPDASGKRVWGGTKDQDFFADILANLDLRGLEYDPNRIFVVGHSNGAGFTQDLACAYGDVIRGIATAAGALTDVDCIGSHAVLLMQGSNDPLTAGNLAAGARNYWTLYNGWDPDVSTASSVGPCDDHSFPGEDNSPYPVLWCEHLEGHAWPSYASQAVWSFFTGLPNAEPTPDAPAGGGAERATPPSDALLTVTIDAPADMNRPLRGVATLRPVSFIDNPTCSAPDVILGLFAVDGAVIPGQISEPITFPITYLDFGGVLEFPSDWALSITVYVEGGSTSVIPTPGVDYDLNVPITVTAKENDLIIDEILVLDPVRDLCGGG